ncbi:hypothetical protein H4R99_000564 [Coemansia sp. RSA 1722]|nr:hypothetical protein IWW45_000414 [Coemansia sp. RSA 485]KAJ2603567.1 hypothetical protein GGF39_000060 [Coemansia sp. RSA 1721]KAJ2606169.1 hypothetical protein H4R99_000564 [Coemansia sp. RSA 1722]KAJ2639708.1 hypothetical protein GGF40_000674 [Coemansia sp. RSA 1286]
MSMLRVPYLRLASASKGRLLPRQPGVIARLYSASSTKPMDTEEGRGKPLFDKILVANRGEIACRVMHTARKLGIQTVAVFSEADRNGLHVKLADEAYLIGGAAAADSYLQAGRIIDVARRTGAQAVHPGYGFLSENAGFADQLSGAGLTFIGPPAAAIRAMGSKSESKRIMQEAGVPVVPGYHGEQQENGFLRERAAEIGYPVLIKAVLGGGGKGMRIVERPEDFDIMLESSRREAIKSFGDDRVLVEKYLATPRHVEVQVFADSLGNAVHLFERDCSVQRRHQKIIEEAPAPGLLADVRRELGAKAVQAAKAVGYVGAGTVEFIMDTDTQQFYFMEMNTRLQVEHPVTEMVTDTDLVRWQLEVASGNRLPRLQNEIACTGHAFEARIYAENTESGFLPDTGRLLHVQPPLASSDVRIETGVRTGDTISVHYDPMIAKLVVHGDDRADALRKLRTALASYQVAGVHTNIGFLSRLAASPDFAAGSVETGYIDKHRDELFPQPTYGAEKIALAGLALIADSAMAASTLAVGGKQSPWAATDAFRINSSAAQSVNVAIGGRQFRVETDSGTVRVLSDSNEVVSEFSGAQPEWTPGESGGDLCVLLGDRLCTASVVFNRASAELVLFSDGASSTFSAVQPEFEHPDESATGGQVTAPMSCKIVQVLVEAGASVDKDTPLVVLEAMKMEHVIRAPAAGTVSDIYYAVGDLVDAGKSLVAFEPNK